VKGIVYVFVIIGGMIGAGIGAQFDGGNVFGFWTIVLSGLGGFLGIWVGYTITKNYF
jgi:hypothetical protein